MTTLTLLVLLAVAPHADSAGSPAGAVALAYADAQKLPAKEAPYYRYLWLSSPEKHRAEFLQALTLHVNLLSDQGESYPPTLIAPDLVRLDVREYGWDKRLEVWEALGKVDVFFHVKVKLLEDAAVRVHWPGGLWPGRKVIEAGRYREKRKAGDLIDQPAPWLPAKEMDALRGLLLSESPVLMAEWFLVQSCRQISIRNVQEGAGYYDWLGLKKRDDFFRLTGTDQKTAERVFREWRAVVDRSGISQQNRQVIRYGSHSGSVRGTLDTFAQKGKGNAKRNLRRGEFAHDAEEWLGFLGNGLPVAFLANKDGEAQESAPDKIGPDDSALRVGRDARVHVILSCIRCHGVDRDFVKPVDDWARKTFRQGGVLRLSDKDKKVVLELKSQYLRDLNELLDDDRIQYARGVRRATGLTWARAAKVYGEAYNRYVETQLTLDDAARELGSDGKTLLGAIRRYEKFRGGSDLILAGFIDEPAQKISRLEWEDSAALAASLLAGVQPPEIAKEEKKEEKEKK